MMRHGVTVDLNLRTLGVEGFFHRIIIDSLLVRQLKINYNIYKPTVQDTEDLESFDVNKPTPSEVWKNMVDTEQQRQG